MTRPRLLYHGSSERCDVLLPHQAVDALEHAGSQLAVYASSSWEVALAFALGATPDEGDVVVRRMDRRAGDRVTMVFLRGHPNFGGKGYVHTLAGDGFAHAGGDQWLRREPAIPLEITEISVDDYLYLFRYGTEAEKRALDPPAVPPAVR